jgi:hypothetical protein
MFAPRTGWLAVVPLLIACSGSSDDSGAGATSSKGGASSGGGSGGLTGNGGWAQGGSGGGSAGITGTGGTSGGGGGSAGGGPCAGKIGQHCGAELGLDASKLYACNDGQASEVETCTGTCIQHGDGSDACPCPNGNGTFCGGHGIPGDATKLYACQDGVITLDKECGGTCDVGSPDACSACPNGNGAYCGGDGIQGDSNTLYNCSGGVLSVVQVCPVSCKVNPPGVADACASCPSGNGAYCGSELNQDPNTLYNCTDGTVSVIEKCGSTCHVSAAGVADYCEGGSSGTGTLSCSNLQWWNSNHTYEWQLNNGGYYWYDTDLAVGSGTPIQLRNDSKLVADPVVAWGWQPQFIDQSSGERFQFLHLRPNSQDMYTTSVGTTYKAGTVVGLSGGDTAATGYPTYSTGAHLCVETLVPFTQAFPPGQDACQ